MRESCSTLVAGVKPKSRSDQMAETFDGDTVQTPAHIVAPDLVGDRTVAKEAAYDSPLGHPPRVDFHLIGDRRRSAIMIECGRALKQPAVAVRPQQGGVAARSIEPHPCREFAQPCLSVTG